MKNAENNQQSSVGTERMSSLNESHPLEPEHNLDLIQNPTFRNISSDQIIELKEKLRETNNQIETQLQVLNSDDKHR